MLIEFLTQTLEGDKAFPSSSPSIAPPDSTPKESKTIIGKTLEPDHYNSFTLMAMGATVGPS